MELWIIASICAFFVKGMCGFANTLVFSSILAFGSNNIDISPVELLLGYPTNIILTWRERRLIKWRETLPVAALVLLGCVAGVLLLKNVNASAIKIVFGVIITLTALEMLLRELSNQKRAPSRLLLTATGLLAGLLCGLYGVGALLGAYMSRVTDDTRAFKGNLCLVLVIENTFRIVLYSITGILTLEAALSALKLAPFMLIGLFGGILSARFLPERIVKRVVIVLLFISGIALIINAL